MMKRELLTLATCLTLLAAMVTVQSCNPRGQQEKSDADATETSETSGRATGSSSVAAALQAEARTLTDGQRIIAKYPDSRRHAMYYIEDTELKRFDAADQSTWLIDYTEGRLHASDVRRIKGTYQSPGGQFIFLIACTQGAEYLFRLDTNTQAVELVGYGDVVEHTGNGYTITEHSNDAGQLVTKINKNGKIVSEDRVTDEDAEE